MSNSKNEIQSGYIDPFVSSRRLLASESASLQPASGKKRGALNSCSDWAKARFGIESVGTFVAGTMVVDQRNVFVSSLSMECSAIHMRARPQFVPMLIRTIHVQPISVRLASW